MYLFQRLFINTLAESPECKDYPSVISGYLGKNWGILLGALYFVMLVIWMFVYSTAITNDSASYLHTFGVTDGLLSENPFYGLFLICILVAISSRGEKLLFKVSSLMVLTKLFVVAARTSASAVASFNTSSPACALPPIAPSAAAIGNPTMPVPGTVTPSPFFIRFGETHASIRVTSPGRRSAAVAQASARETGSVHPRAGFTSSCTARIN
jgi:hypothetical protein